MYTIKWIRKGQMDNFRILEGHKTKWIEGARWYRRLCPRCYHVLEIINYEKEHGQPYNHNNIQLKYIVNLYHVDMNAFTHTDIEHIMEQYETGEYDELDLLNETINISHNKVTLLTLGSNCADDAIRYVAKPFSRQEVLNEYDGVYVIHNVQFID